MASYTEGELIYVLNVCLFVITEIAFFVGLVTQVYILAVNVVDWGRGRRISTSDQVIIFIMISRMMLQSFIQMNIFWNYYCVVCSHVSFAILRFIYFSTMYSTTWLSTLLCVVFYLKISNFCHVLFLSLRRIFSKRILYIIIASLLVSIGQTSNIYLVSYLTDSHNVSINATHGDRRQPSDAAFFVYLVNLFGPIVIYLFSSLFLITYLNLHIKQMRGNSKVTTSMDIYNRIIIYTASSIFTSALCVIISALAERFYHIFGFILVSFPWTTSGTLHSITLIFITPKLKNPISGLLKCFSNYVIGRQEPRDIWAHV